MDPSDQLLGQIATEELLKSRNGMPTDYDCVATMHGRHFQEFINRVLSLRQVYGCCFHHTAGYTGTPQNHVSAR